MLPAIELGCKLTLLALMLTKMLKLWSLAQMLQKELAYAEAQAARFTNGTAMQPERNIAQRRYAELMEGIGDSFAQPFVPCY